MVAMGRKSAVRPLSIENIIIVCEGTETEHDYFEELAKSYNEKCRVVPNPSDVISKELKNNRLNNPTQERVLKNNGRQVLPYYYADLEEKEVDNYGYYCAEPLRWVRAAQLYQQRDGYYEAWAVYDLDKQRDASHPKAYDEAKKSQNLHIAFSAYSIEEWFLLHFERNSRSYQRSECEDNTGRKVICGHNDCTSPLNCNGTTCIGGRLRFAQYIPAYKKNAGREYAQITKDRFHQACVNAAWVRSLNDAEPYNCNPYSDVDKLVMRLLGKRYEITWPKKNVTFSLLGDQFRLQDSAGVITLVYEGDAPLKIIAHDNIYWCDNQYLQNCSACTGANLNFTVKERERMLVNKPSGSAILCIIDQESEVYFEFN